MFSRLTLLLAVAFASIAVLLARNFQVQSTGDSNVPYVSGKNNTLLFIVNEHPGLSNVHMASAQALLETYPHITLHLATFPRSEKTVARISSFVKKRQPESKGITFHPVDGIAHLEALFREIDMHHDEDGKSVLITAPGLEGIGRLANDMQTYIDPYTVEEHFSMYRQLLQIIEKVDPAAVILDASCHPGVEATRAANRVHAFISPNIAVDHFPDRQPYLGMLWKYPAMGSGYPFPVPLSKILPNIYMNFVIISSVMRTPLLAAKRKALIGLGVPDPINQYALHRPDTPFITQTTPGMTVPVDVIPLNVTCAGPINLSAAPAEEQDPELSRWVSGGDTVLINLGSAFTYSRTQTRQMAAAVQILLDTTDLQILWKYKITPHVQDFDWQALVKPLQDTRRVRVERWLSIDPSSLLELDKIVAFVTHGGANGFHEGVQSGVPQVVLPMWVDLYGYAQLAEQTGLGIWACRDTSPDWTPECLAAGIARVASGAESVGFRKVARDVSASVARNGRGRDIAAKILAGLAQSGRA